MLSESKIIDRFEKAAPSYHEHSDVQARMAARLISLISLERPPSRVLELGCGTGHLSKMLLEKFLQAEFHITDGSESMLEACRKNLSVCQFPQQLQMSCLPVGELRNLQAYDLICSNAVVQWVEGIADHFLKVSRALKPSAVYLCSGFSPENFKELQSTVLQVTGKAQGRVGLPYEELQNSLEKSGLALAYFKQEEWLVQYPNFFDFLRVLKKTGTNGVNNDPFSSSQLKKIGENYQLQHSQENAVNVTWSPWFCVLKKEISFAQPQ